MELDMIHRKAIAQGDGNDSAALRSILREWQDMNAMLTRIAITPAGQQAIASEAPRE
jgi:signal recognition particle GTPase